MGQVKQPFGHLSDAQIEHYGNHPAVAGSGQADRETDLAVESHLAACGECRTRVLEFHRSRLGLMSSPDSTPARRPNEPTPAATSYSEAGPTTPDCPPDDSLRDLAAGLLSSGDGARLTQHAAQCDHCGPILRAYSEDFADDLSAEDQQLLDQLSSSSASWQKKIAKQMAEAATEPSAPASLGATAALAKKIKESSRLRLPSLKWLLVPATAIATAVIAFFIWNSQRETPQRVEKLLAQAYTEQRTMEMRWPGAVYAPMRLKRGPDDSFNRPASLLRAESIIQSTKIGNPDWLRAKAQAEILKWNSHAAIDLLNRALQARPDSESIMVDLAVANLQLAQTSREPEKYITAIDLLTKVVTKNSRNQEALFNLGLAYGGAEMWEQAAATWRRYLQLDPEGPWATEANLNLKQAEMRIRSAPAEQKDLLQQ